MNREEFGRIIAYLCAATGKSVTVETAEVYYDLLGDLPFDVGQAAVRQACLENASGFMPPLGVIRKLAAQAIAGKSTQITAGEAWSTAKSLVGQFGLDGETKALQSVSPLIADAIRAFGWRCLCDMPPGGSTYDWDKWAKIFGPLQARNQTQALLPPKLAEQLASIGKLPDENETLKLPTDGKR